MDKSYSNDAVKESMIEEIDFIKNQIKTLENESRRIISQNENLQNDFEIITSIKGVEEKLALVILADANYKNFKTGKQFAAFAGVTPSHFESGTSVRKKSRISKIGSSNLRKILYMNALVVKNRNENFADFVKKLEKKGKCAKVIICAIMRKLMSIIFGMLKNNQKFSGNLAFAC